MPLLTELGIFGERKLQICRAYGTKKSADAFQVQAAGARARRGRSVAEKLFWTFQNGLKF
jgi:hypothetical protein